jgi:hypothetical protein
MSPFWCLEFEVAPGKLVPPCLKRAIDFAEMLHSMLANLHFIISNLSELKKIQKNAIFGRLEILEVFWGVMLRHQVNNSH